MLNTSHDITAYKKAEETQRIATSEMERALRIKNEFLANMSHELRTPLNSILGISESLEEQIAGVLNEKQLKYIGIVRESGRHLLDLINDILDLSKIEAGQMKVEIHPVSVEKLCQSSLRMVKELAQKKSLNVSYKTSDEGAVISGDERRLKQSLVNLLTNAVKFTPPGSRIGLEVFGNSDNNEIEFTVWDQGIGIAQTDIQQLFKPFVQLDAGLTREYQGTGLGLALVAQMVQLHDGRIRVDSEPGSGSRFTITLPWLPNEQNIKPKVTDRLSSVPVHEAGKNTNRRILLVEDTDVVVQLVSEYLRYKGYEVLLAHNGVEGMQMAIEEHPDLILMDVMMPYMNGLEATQNIRKDESLKDTPIIALTALAMSGDSEKCIAAGMNDYLSKPIQMKHLADMIEKYMGPAGKNRMKSKILIVDDDPLGIETLESILAGEDYDISSANNGIIALRRAAEILPDMILLDVMMPGMDGFEVCRRIRATPELAEVPIIILTALDDRPSLLLGIESGADDFLSKPVDRQELRIRVKTIVRLNRYRTLLTQRDDLRQMANRIVTAQEEERKRVSREIHDDLGQALIAHTLNLRNLQSDLPLDTEMLRSRLDILMADTNQTIHKMRLLAQGIRPPLLDTNGLRSALETYCREFSLRTKLPVIFEASKTIPEMSDVYCITLFRTLQEALTNVIKHSDAKQVWVELIIEESNIVLTVQDNGTGFLVSKDESKKGIGIIGLRERLTIVGGELTIKSSTANGTILSARLPWEETQSLVEKI